MTISKDALENGLRLLGLLLVLGGLVAALRKARGGRIAIAATTVNAPLIEVEPAWLVFVLANPTEAVEAAVLTEAPGGRGTEVRVPCGTARTLPGAARKQQVEGLLRRFKQLVETGEIVISEQRPAGRGQERPAQPLGSATLLGTT